LKLLLKEVQVPPPEVLLLVPQPVVLPLQKVLLLLLLPLPQQPQLKKNNKQFKKILTIRKMLKVNLFQMMLEVFQNQCKHLFQNQFYHHPLPKNKKLIQKLDQPDGEDLTQELLNIAQTLMRDLP
jgi:hypothetical protein